MTYRNHYLQHFAPIELFADLEITCGAGKIVVKADGNNVFFRLPSFKTAYAILTILGRRAGSADFLTTVDQVFKHFGITLFWQNTYFAILGSKSKPYLLKTLIGIQKVIKFFALGANRRRRSH